MKIIIKALKKTSTAALVPLLLTSSMAMWVSTDVIAGPKAEGYGAECALLNGNWKHIRSEIYSCQYRYKHYSVYDFKNSTVRRCDADGCTKVAIHNRDNGNPKSAK